jgi:hypothetical protein
MTLPHDIDRLDDWRRERRIAALSRKYEQTHARVDWLALAAEINARSPEMVARMERKRGLAR